MSAAFLFPGQGSQVPGMLHALPSHPAIDQTLDEVSEVLGADVRALDTSVALRSTVSVQLALLAAGVATANALVADGVKPRMVGGLSVGAFAAAVTAQVISLRDAVMLVKKRAEMMEALYPVGYGLAVIIGLLENEVAAIVESLSQEGRTVFMGNINAPRQVVISGDQFGLESAVVKAKALGARRAEALIVPTLSHCVLLEPIASELRNMLASIEVHPPAVWYIGNLNGRRLSTAESIAEDLAGNIAHGVRWHEMTSLMVELGCDLFLEMPPGNVLTTLARESFPTATAVAMAETSLRSASLRWQRSEL